MNGTIQKRATFEAILVIVYNFFCYLYSAVYYLSVYFRKQVLASWSLPSLQSEITLASASDYSSTDLVLFLADDYLHICSVLDFCYLCQWILSLPILSLRFTLYHNFLFSYGCLSIMSIPVHNYFYTCHIFFFSAWVFHNFICCFLVFVDIIICPDYIIIPVGYIFYVPLLHHYYPIYVNILFWLDCFWNICWNG